MTRTIFAARWRSVVSALAVSGLLAMAAAPVYAGHHDHPGHYRPHHDHWNWGWYVGLNSLWLTPWVWNSYRWDEPRYIYNDYRNDPVYRVVTVPTGVVTTRRMSTQQQPTIQQPVQPAVQQITTGYQVTSSGPRGRSELPANARVIQQGSRILYEWQGQLYRFDWSVQQYLPVTEDTSASR